MPAYTYLAYDLLTNAPVAELPLSGVTYSLVLNDDGGMSGYIPAAAARGRADLRDVHPGRTAVYVDRDGYLVAGYVYWDDDPQPSKIDIPSGGCRGLLSYFDHRRIAATRTYAKVDQLAIARDLIAYCQTQTSGDIGVELGTELSGVLRDRTYPGTELHNVREALQQLGAVINGFDFRIDVSYGPDGAPRKVLTFGYPELGQPVAATGLVLEYPGNIQAYQWTRAGSQIANKVYGIGAGDGSAALRATATNNVLLNVGWPLLEADVSYTDISRQSTLNDYTLLEALTRDGIVVTPQVTIRGDDPPVGSYQPGDYARLRITDDVFGGDGMSPDIDVEARITEMSVTVPDDSDVEVVTLTLSALLVPL